jgi:L-alanine-DL-glutamate epimerase-like enolase superfamily enzyme
VAFTADVVIEQGPYSPVGGVLRVPDAPGLGVTLDRNALARPAAVNRVGQE